MSLIQSGLNGLCYQTSRVQRKRPASSYQAALAEIHTFAQALAQRQDVPLFNLLADAQTHANQFNGAAALGAQDGNGVAGGQPHYSWPSQDTVAPDHQDFQYPYTPFTEAQAINAGGSGGHDPAVTAATNTFATSTPMMSDHILQHSLRDNNVWPMTLAVSPSRPEYQLQGHEIRPSPTNTGVTDYGISSPSVYQHAAMPQDMFTPTPIYECDAMFGLVPQQEQPTSLANHNNIALPMRLASTSTSTKPVTTGRIHKRKSTNDHHRNDNQRQHYHRPTKRYEDEQLQLETNETRKKSACIRCQMQRLRCITDPNNPHGPCLTCQAVTGPTQYKLQCLRYRISNALLLDHGRCPRGTWTTRWQTMQLRDIEDWRSSSIKIITITQDIASLPIELKVREFVPRKGDSLARHWVEDGRSHAYRCPPYAIENMRETGRQYKNFIDQNLVKYLQFYTASKDPIISDTYQMAWRHLHDTDCDAERELLQNVLQLWMGCRMETRSDRICGKETLGMIPYHGSHCANTGRILLPPVLSAQIEIIVTTMILKPTAEAVLRSLQKLISTKRSHSWFTIYLAMFILMHSCSLMTAADYQKARKQGDYSGPYRRALIEELHFGAKILLAHFHYCSKGSSPFAREGHSISSFTGEHYSEAQLHFLRSTRQHVLRHENLFHIIRETQDIENEMYFLAQLYEKDWEPHQVGL